MTSDPNTLVIPDPAWAERFQIALAKDNHATMGVAWSYLLANLAAGPADFDKREELRIRVTTYLVHEVAKIWTE